MKRIFRLGGFLASFPVHFCPRSLAAPLNNNLAYASKQAGLAGRRRNYFASSFRVIRKRERAGERANAILGAC